MAEYCEKLKTCAVAVALGFAPAIAFATPHPVPYATGAAHVGTRFADLILVQESGAFHTQNLPTAALQRARKRMIAGQRISFDEMRAIADAGDGLAAFRYADRLLGLNDPALLDDAAHYFAVAAHTGRDYAVGPLLRVLATTDLQINPKRLQHIETALRRHALQGDTKATDALIGFYSTGKPFGLQPDAANELQQAVALNGDPQAAIEMALRAVSDPATTLSDADIAALLQIAVKSENLGLRTTAQNVLGLLEKRAAASGDDAAAAADAPEEDLNLAAPTPIETGVNE